MKALKINCFSLQFADRSLYYDKDIINNAIKKDKYIEKYLNLNNPNYVISR